MPDEPRAKPRKNVKPIRLAGPVWEWILKRAKEEDLSAPEFIRRLVDEARVREPYDTQIIGRLTKLEERIAALEAEWGCIRRT